MMAPFFAFKRLEPRYDQRIGVGHQTAEREVFELVADALHAHAARKRRIDVERVLGDSRALGFGHEVERAHVVQAVGELDQKDARVVGDGEQKLAEILGLLGVLGDEVELAEFGKAVDQAADLLAERLVDVLARRLGVFDRIVQHGRGDRRVVHLELGQDRGDLERMGEIGVAGGALLRAVRLHGEHIGAVQQVFVGARIVAADTLHQFVLPHHGRNVRTFPLAPKLATDEPRSVVQDVSTEMQRREKAAGSTGRGLPHASARASGDHRPAVRRSQGQNMAVGR